MLLCHCTRYSDLHDTTRHHGSSTPTQPLCCCSEPPCITCIYGHSPHPACVLLARLASAAGDMRPSRAAVARGVAVKSTFVLVLMFVLVVLLHCILFALGKGQTAWHYNPGMIDVHCDGMICPPDVGSGVISSGGRLLCQLTLSGGHRPI